MTSQIKYVGIKYLHNNTPTDNGVVLTETRVVGAIIQPLPPAPPAKLKPMNDEEKVTMIKQDMVKQIDTKSPKTFLTMTLPQLPTPSSYMKRCKNYL